MPPEETTAADRRRVDRDTFVRLRTGGFVVASALWAVVTVADLTGRLAVGLRPLTWLHLLSLLVVAAYVVAPLVVDRTLAAYYWSELRENRLAVASLGFVVALVAVGTVGPLVVETPTTHLTRSYQPPAFTSVHTVIAKQCVGTVSGDHCWGTLAHPLGTDAQGRDVLALAVMGSRVAAQIALVAGLLMVPVGTAVGLLAGYRGGWADDVLMRYVEVQGAVPAFLVYLVLVTVFGRSLVMLVLVFGLLNWGGVARLVRTEVVQRRETSYVQASRLSGAGPLYVVRRVLLPNVSNTIVTEVSRQASTMVLVESALAFMSLSELGIGSWGESIAWGLDGLFFPDTWWISTVPVVALALTVLAFGILGDGLRDALDPGS